MAIEINNFYKRTTKDGATIKAIFYSDNYDNNVLDESELTSRFFCIDTDTEEAWVEIEIETIMVGAKIEIEVAGNGFIVKNKKDVQVCGTKYELDNIIKKMTILESVLRVEIDSADFDYQNELEQYKATH